MIDLDAPFPHLSESRRDADIERLRLCMAAAPSERRLSPRQRLLAVSSVFVALAVGGAATAAVVLAPEKPSNVHVGRCYWEPSTDTSKSDFPGSLIAGAESRKGWKPDLAAQIDDMCADLWQSGFFQVGSPGAHSALPASGQVYPVPVLTPCVLPNGDAAVFPGGDDTCGTLGFAPLATS